MLFPLTLSSWVRLVLFPHFWSIRRFLARVMMGSNLKTGRKEAPVGVAVRVTRVCEGRSIFTGTLSVADNNGGIAMRVGGVVRTFLFEESVAEGGNEKAEAGVRGGGPGRFCREGGQTRVVELEVDLDETLLPEKDVEDGIVELKLLLFRSGREDRYS